VPYKVFASNEEVTSADFNTYLANQVVPTFTDAAQRSVQLPSPDKGQLCALDTYSGALWMWNGDEWVEPVNYTQSGNVVVPINAGGGGAITYPRPFALGGVAISLTDGDAGTTCNQYGVIHDQNLATACGFVAYDKDGAPVVSVNVRVLYTAVGYRSPD
jgi:hypothetical protein